MEQHSELFIGLDTSKLKISVAVAGGERTGEVRFFGDISSDPGAVASMAAKLAKGGAPLRFCYEAGPTGYDLYRRLSIWAMSALWSPHRWCRSDQVIG